MSDRLPILIKKGSEADLFLIDWYDKQAISKLRTKRSYRHPILDRELRYRRTIHEAEMLSKAKEAGIRSPYLYFLDSQRNEIIMEYIEGVNLKAVLSADLALKLGECIAKLHFKNIIHGDVTTSNFILERLSRQNNTRLAIIDFGLSFYSQRLEDMASDVRMLKEVLNSVHHELFEQAFSNFVKAYSSFSPYERGRKVLRKVDEIESRGRYSRIADSY
ncbi:MAG: KEOPS complex kinase/ATPase Bud32 [Nitrososphaeraceae archaeon]